jgi:hypothetical protein
MTSKRAREQAALIVLFVRIRTEFGSRIFVPNSANCPRPLLGFILFVESGSEPRGAKMNKDRAPEMCEALRSAAMRKALADINENASADQRPDRRRAAQAADFPNK